MWFEGRCEQFEWLERDFGQELKERRTRRKSKFCSHRRNKTRGTGTGASQVQEIPGLHVGHGYQDANWVLVQGQTGGSRGDSTLRGGDNEAILRLRLSAGYTEWDI
jgi:hypothetical protein